MGNDSILPLCLHNRNIFDGQTDYRTILFHHITSPIFVSFDWNGYFKYNRANVCLQNDQTV